MREFMSMAEKRRAERFGKRIAREEDKPLTVEQDYRRQLVERPLPRTLKHPPKSHGGCSIVSDEWGIVPRLGRGGRKPSLNDYENDH